MIIWLMFAIFLQSSIYGKEIELKTFIFQLIITVLTSIFLSSTIILFGKYLSSNKKINMNKWWYWVVICMYVCFNLIIIYLLQTIVWYFEKPNYKLLFIIPVIGFIVGLIMPVILKTTKEISKKEIIKWLTWIVIMVMLMIITICLSFFIRVDKKETVYDYFKRVTSIEFIIPIFVPVFIWGNICYLMIRYKERKDKN